MTGRPSRLADALRALAPDLRGRVAADAPLAPFTWFRVGGPAEALVSPADEDDLAYLLSSLPATIPVAVIGVGSNLIVRDGGVRGVVVRLGGKGFGAVETTADFRVVAGAAALDALKLVGAANIDGKPVLDACNPIGGGPPVHGVLSFFTDLSDSLMERLQKAYPKAHFVKAFNSVGAGQMVDPHFAGGQPTMFICGDDEAAKQTVARLTEDFGWEVADMGAVEAARAIEPLCMLWCIPGVASGDWSPHAFKLLR